MNVDNTRRVVVAYRTYDHEWKVTGPEMQTDKYYMLEWSWDPENGLSLYEDGRKVATQMTGTSITSSPTGSRTYDETRNFYIGRAQTDTINSYYSNITIDEFQAWEIKRDYLIFNNDICKLAVCVLCNTKCAFCVYKRRAGITIAKFM